MKNIFGVRTGEEPTRPIDNPFGDFYDHGDSVSKNITLRTKKGDRTIEIEFPYSERGMSEMTVPMNPNFRDQKSRSVSMDDDSSAYDEIKTTMTDREILKTLPQSSSSNNTDRNQIESELGVRPSEDSVPENDSSYIAALGRVKQLFKRARYELASVEIDKLIRLYPTDPKLFTMRGTILDRMGYPQLAIKSWEQALQLNPGNQSLRGFIERRKNGGRLPAS